MANDNNEHELNEFQLRNINILTHLLAHNAINDDIVEDLRKSELDYFSLIDKYNLLQQKVNIDEKTNLLKFKTNYLTDIIKTASRIYYGSNANKYYISMIRFDIDDFSMFNNKYGHDVGDAVLIEIANSIRNNSRPTDYVIRFGGEELDVILPGTPIEGARTYLNKVFNKIRELEIEHSGDILKVTVSAGASEFEYIFSEKKRINAEEIINSYKELQNEADNALYESKYLGKNQFCFYSKDKKDEYVKIREKYALHKNK